MQTCVCTYINYILVHNVLIMLRHIHVMVCRYNYVRKCSSLYIKPRVPLSIYYELLIKLTFLSSVHSLQINLLSSSKTSRDVYSAKHWSKLFIFPDKGSVVNLVHICGLKSFNNSCSSLGFSALLVSE